MLDFELLYLDLVYVNFSVISSSFIGLVLELSFCHYRFLVADLPLPNWFSRGRLL